AVAGKRARDFRRVAAAARQLARVPVRPIDDAGADADRSVRSPDKRRSSSVAVGVVRVRTGYRVLCGDQLRGLDVYQLVCQDAGRPRGLLHRRCAVLSGDAGRGRVLPDRPGRLFGDRPRCVEARGYRDVTVEKSGSAADAAAAPFQLWTTLSTA